MGFALRYTEALAAGDGLKRLQTDYIDLYYVHAWDFATSIPELGKASGSPGPSKI